MLIVGKTYTRDETVVELGGGSNISYLPTKGGRILGGRFRLDLNPLAPDVVVVGHTAPIENPARLFGSSKNPVPVFIKEAINKWRYKGLYRCKRQSFAPSDLSKYGSHRTDPITSILFLEAL